MTIPLETPEGGDPVTTPEQPEPDPVEPDPDEDNDDDGDDE